MTAHNEHKLISMAEALKKTQKKSHYNLLLDYMFSLTRMDIELFVERTGKRWEWYTSNPKWCRNFPDLTTPNEEHAKTRFGVELYNTGIWYWFGCEAKDGVLSFRERYSQRTGKSDCFSAISHNTKISTLLKIKGISKEAFEYAIGIASNYSQFNKE